MICSCSFITFILPFFTQSQNNWTTTGIQNSGDRCFSVAGIIVAATQNNGVAILTLFRRNRQYLISLPGDMSTKWFQGSVALTKNLWQAHWMTECISMKTITGKHFTRSKFAGNYVTDFAFDSLNDIIYVATDGGLASIQNNIGPFTIH